MPIVSGKTIIKFLTKQGFQIVAQKGSHVRLKKKTNGKLLVRIVPLHKQLGSGTLLAILHQAETPKEKLMHYL